MDDNKKKEPTEEKHNHKEEEEDQISEAYENISKKLSNIRKDDDDSDDEDEEKGEDEESSPSDEPLDALPGTEEEKDEDPKPTFPPDDPLDKEDEDAADEKPQETDDFEKEEEKDLDDLAGEKTSSSDEKTEDPSPRKSFSSLSDEGHRGEDEIPGIKHKPGFGSDVSFSKPNYPPESHPNNYFNRHTTDVPRRRGNLMHLIILVLIGLAVIGGTVYLLKYQFNATPSVTPTPTPEATQEPTPEPTPTFDRSKFKVRVLNGTTTAGLAKSVSDKLKELGYQIERTGNAPKQDFKSAEIKAKAEATGLADQLKADLASDYTASVSGELKASDAADAEVILGVK